VDGGLATPIAPSDHRLAGCRQGPYDIDQSATLDVSSQRMAAAKTNFVKN